MGIRRACDSEYHLILVNNLLLCCFFCLNAGDSRSNRGFTRVGRFGRFASGLLLLLTGFGALKSAPSSHYTLQLSSSSNYDNLNGWAKKENLKNYVVYETTRNGQPWYVLVTGMYASKEDAKRAVSTLPADVQAKNPWAKPLHQVQADLK